jgi:hypothetical protein
LHWNKWQPDLEGIPGRSRLTMQTARENQRLGVSCPDKKTDWAGRQAMSNKIKGNILEDLVAMMHEVPGVRVEKLVLLVRENVGERHLSSLVDKKHVDGVGGIGRCPEPTSGPCDVCGATYRVQQIDALLRKLETGLIRFRLGRLLNAADINVHFCGHHDIVEQIANDLVAVCGHANRLASLAHAS